MNHSYIFMMYDQVEILSRKFKSKSKFVNLNKNELMEGVI